MNALMNAIVNRGGCFHNLHKMAKVAIFPKNPWSTKKKTQVEGVDPTPQVLNKKGPWVP